MICKGEVYRAQVNPDSQQGALVLVVSGDASNHSEATTVTVLEVVPRRAEVEPEIEAAFELNGKRVKVWPYSLRVIPKEELEATPVATLEGFLLDQVDALLAFHFALSPASLEGPGSCIGPGDEGEAR